MNPFLEANLAVLEELCADLSELVAPLGSDELNWTPLAADSNSIAAMVTHTVASLDNWLARALDEPVSRDRDAEFRVEAIASDLVTSIELCLERTRRRFELLDEIDPSTIRQVVRLSRGFAADVSVAWCVEHAVIHTGEHWGQIQLTHQLYGSSHVVGDH